MPTKAIDPETGLCRVEFRLPAEAGAERAWVAGDFNGWSLDATPMEPSSDGALVAIVLVEPGQNYRFRYYLGDDRWENDWAADAYVDNDFGGADSLLSVPEAGAAPAAKKRAPRKAAAKKAAGTTKPAKKKD